MKTKELCRSVPKPAISLLQFYNDYEQSTPEDRAAIPIGQLLLNKIAMLESRSVDKLQASVNSLASSFVQHTKVAIFLDELDDDCDATEEVERRRAERELVSQTMQSAIGHMLNYIRDYHLDIRTGSLESCKNRKTCENHLTWKDVKIFREKCRAENKNPDDFEPADLIGL
ncbi:hypothetical protein L3Y34_019031 [Caenorhabditis briggsae]|uniref:Uncharacterized protein n=1 Tax=Caenorhabditis briggsae TaxID=6238 RepID=A0AAE9IVG8_CAEBR|nr:hypothetical protein L3Y34_019031 [Caenorhabditis briggsae]